MNINLNLLKAEMLVIKNYLSSNYNHDNIKYLYFKRAHISKCVKNITNTSINILTIRERNFSSIRQLKNWFRTSMKKINTEILFTDLSKFNIEVDICSKITSAEMLERSPTPLVNVKKYK